MRKIISRIVIGAVLSAVFVGCDNSLKYEYFETVNEQEWYYKNELNFVIPIMEESPKNFLIAVRNTGNYQRANLWLFLTLTSPSGVVLRDTLDCLLADDYGYWVGDGFSGLYATEHFVKDRKLAEKGDWKLTVTHGMRQDTIQGIKEIGVLVRETKK